MIHLILQPDRIPRTTTREQWRAMWQWKRNTERVLRELAERNREAIVRSIEETLIYGRSTIQYDINGLTHPVVMIYPEPTEPFKIDLRPGAINKV